VYTRKPLNTAMPLLPPMCTILSWGNTAQFPPCGLSTAPASAAPRSPYRHLELCGIALDKMVDTRPGSEWFWQADKYGTPAHKPIVEPWKCPYHNGRMCMELMRRNPDVNV